MNQRGAVEVLDINEMAENLEEKYKWQSTPYPVYIEDYVKIVTQAIKKFFVDVNHPGEYDRTLYTTDEHNNPMYDYDFDVVQEEYIFILCQLYFMRILYGDVSGDKAISYTTDALSVTGAKEGYKSIQQSIDELEQERVRVFHKMMARDTNET